MKILHCCLSNFYADEHGYQENMLTELSLREGHEVRIVTSEQTYVKGELGFVPPGEYTTPSGIPVVRLPYRCPLPRSVGAKLRMNRGFMRELTAFAPDIIFFHGSSAYEMITAARYCQRHPETLFVVDSHAAMYNSGLNFVSRELLHKLYYRMCYRLSKKNIDRLYYIGYAEHDYLRDILGADESSMELLSLGGIVTETDNHTADREQIIARHGLPQDCILLLHTGRLKRLSRLDTLLEAFHATEDKRLRLIIIGKPVEDLSDLFDKYVPTDDRIIRIDWMESAELSPYLSAADIYVQPGAVSATLQRTLCSGTPALIQPLDTYCRLFGDCGGVRYAETANDIKMFFNDICEKPEQLAEMRAEARRFAIDNLDYRGQIRRVCAECEAKRARLHTKNPTDNATKK